MKPITSTTSVMATPIIHSGIRRALRALAMLSSGGRERPVPAVAS